MLPGMQTLRVLLLSLVLALKRATAGQKPALETAQVNGVTLHYFVTGRGAPVVLVHGALDDYRMWESHIDTFAQHYRVLDYSRRYNFPNRNNPVAPDYSAITDADDLAALLYKLQLGPVHIVAHSYGGYAALFLTVQHPELVRSLVLAEPAALCWVRDDPRTRPLLDEQIATLWSPLREACARGDEDGALRIALDYFEAKGTFDRLPEAPRTQLREDLPELHALTGSSDAFPSLPREQTAKIEKPVLLLTGENTQQIFRIVIQQLQQLVPSAEKVTIPGAKHEMWAEAGVKCRKATLQFLSRHVDSLN